MTFKSLWAPWRMEYIHESKKFDKEQCLFCKILSDGEKKANKNLVVAFRPKSFIIMNRFPYSNGHLLIVPVKHRRNLFDYSKAELSDLMSSLKECEKALIECLNCEGLNIGINLGKAAGAGIDQHLHIHIVPRWSGDTNYMTVTGEIRVIPQHINETYKILKNYIQKKSPGRKRDCLNR